MPSLTETLARFSLAAEHGALPERVLDKTKLLVLDAVGLALAAAREEVATSVMAALAEFGEGGRCTAIGFTDRLPVVNAPLVNGMLIHAFDFDDTHHPLVIHNESVVVPAALAVGEREGADGRTFLAACAAGFETSLRVARGTAVTSIHTRGFHPTAVCGVFGGTVAAGRLLGLDEQGLVHALGLAGAAGSGNMEWQSDGSWSKRFQPGWAAHASVVAALLAAKGFTAPRTALEGPRGFYATHVGAGSFDVESAAAGIGEEWELDNTEFKPYPCAGILQATVRAGVELHRRHHLDPEAIEEVECRIALGHEGQERVFGAGAPTGDYGAHFSIPFIAATALLKGRLALSDFEGEALRDPVVAALAARVRISDDPESGRPKYASGHMVVRTRDGASYEHRQHIHPGHVECPVTPDEVREKFTLNAGRLLGAEETDALAASILRLEELDSLEPVLAPLRLAP